MIRLTSARQARALRETLYELAVLRMVQLEGTDGRYDPEIHGHVVVLQEGDDPVRDFPEFGEAGLLTAVADGWPLFDYVEGFDENGLLLFEAVCHLDDERTVAAIIPDAPWLDPRLRDQLTSYLTPRKESL